MPPLPNIANFSSKYFILSKVYYTYDGDLKELYHGLSPVREIIHQLKLVDYLLEQADKQLFNYYLQSIGAGEALFNLI